jgi:CubicO group peptidase (beta-lactamase class C family)
MIRFTLQSQIINHKGNQENMSANHIKTCLKFSLGLIFMLILQSLSAQPDFSQLEKILKQNEKTLGKDLVVVVQKEGKNIFLKESEDFKLKMPAPIGNSSKWLTAALVMIFVDEGKLNLDDPVNKYVPVFGKYMKGYITIRHCLSQTTGLDADATGFVKFTQKSKFNTLEEEMEFFASKKLIVDNPGEAFSEGTVGMNMAGRVLEVITKKTFDRVAQEKLFRPLGMRTASFYDEGGKAPNPSSGAICSAFDYLNFLQMIMNKGMFNGKRVLSETSVNYLLQHQFPESRTRFNPDLTKGWNYAAGSWIEEDNGNTWTNIYSGASAQGVWPWIDLKRKYIGIVLPVSPLNMQKRDLYMQIRSGVEAAID